MIGGSKDEPKDKKDGKDQKDQKKSGGGDQPGDSAKGGKDAKK